MDRRYIEELIKNIRNSIKCPNCNASYHSGFISIIGEVSDTILVKLKCSFCQMPVFASVSIRNQKISENNLDQSSFQENNSENNNIEAKGITTDDIIEMHEFLKNFDGNFNNFLK